MKSHSTTNPRAALPGHLNLSTQSSSTPGPALTLSGFLWHLQSPTLRPSSHLHWSCLLWVPPCTYPIFGAIWLPHMSWCHRRAWKPPACCAALIPLAGGPQALRVWAVGGEGLRRGVLWALTLSSPALDGPTSSGCLPASTPSLELCTS